MKGNIDTEQQSNNKPRKIDWDFVAKIYIAVFKTGILFFLLLIYWGSVSANIITPYSYFLIGIGVCIFGIALFILVRSVVDKSSLSVNLFSVNRVRADRVIREIMVLRNADENIFKGKESVKTMFQKALKDAEEQARKYQFEESWGNILNAETLLMSSIDDSDKDSMKVRAKLILIESEKVKSDWRAKQIKALLGKDIDNQPDISKENLIKAITIRNDYYLTRSHKINLHKVNVNILTLVMFLILGAILFFSFQWHIATLNIDKDQNFERGLVIAAIFGSLGAGFSYGKTLFSYNPESNKIPDQLLSMAVTTFRFIIGASSAIIILLLFKSNFLSEQFSKPILESPVAYIVFSFVAGFSERWIVKMIGLVSKE